MITHLLPMLQSAASEMTPEQQAALGAALGVFGIIYFAIFLLIVISLWKIFTKAGEPGWASIVPIYNAIVLLKISGKPWWWLLLLIIPGVNFVIGILAFLGLAKNFGKGGGFAVGLLLLGFIFFPILAFGSARFEGQKG